MLGEWLKKNCLANNIWWALNPGSGDTGTSHLRPERHIDSPMDHT